jgi:hypothetical protein
MTSFYRQPFFQIMGTMVANIPKIYVIAMLEEADISIF